VKSGNRYQVHSPFLYNFIGEVIRPKTKITETRSIEKIRAEYLCSREIIQKTDFGAGAEGKELRKYHVSINKIAKHSLTSRTRAARLFRLARFLQAKQILEIGTSLGITAFYLATANRQARVVTLEGCPELSRIARNSMNNLGLENVEVVTGRFEKTLDPALGNLGAVDLVYFDGNHRRDAVLAYFNQCLPFIRNKTVFVFDDIHSSGEMEQAWNEIRQHEKVRVSLDFFFSGWIFFREELSVQQFNLRYF
jgi:predicted O-methyltransferase YrrM